MVARVLSGLLMLGAGAAVALGPLSPAVVVDRTGDWRQLCVGCRRAGADSDALSLPPKALVHLHGLDGRQQGVELRLQARQAPVKLEVARSLDGPVLFEARLGPTPERLTIPVAPETRELDLWLRGGPALLQAVVLSRSTGALDRVLQWLPLLGGVLAFGVLRRQPLPLALTFSFVTLAVVALAALTLHDPLGLLEMRALPRQRLQTAFVAALAAGALWRAPERREALAALAAASWLLHLPALNNGLVSDDFLWARSWTLSDVGSTFWGSEDPAGKSNVYYRPLSATAHAVDSWVWRSWIAGYHLTNLLLHPLATGAGLLLLERLGLSRRAAFLGALAWVVHPMSASAVAWVSQRTDLIACSFYLSALIVLLSPLGRRGWPPLIPALLALGSKELAISLPAVAAVFVWLALPAEEARRRGVALAGVALLAASHAIWWIRLFPEVAGYRLFGGAARPAAEAWPGLLHGLTGVAASVAWPSDYETWWKTRLDARLAWRILGCAALPLLAVRLRRCARCGGAPAAAAALAAAWPLLVALPLFGIRLVDHYRLGFIPGFAIALVAGALAHHLEHARDWRPIPLGLVLVAWLAPLSLQTAQEWGPGGFYYEMSLTLERRLPDWRTGLSPLALGLYERQLAASDHLQEAADRLEAQAAVPP